tara:strand:+ start:328 stop:456 length:129 start_codon:yes stop_codon:yes gene_type:complete
MGRGVRHRSPIFKKLSRYAISHISLDDYAHYEYNKQAACSKN